MHLIKAIDSLFKKKKLTVHYQPKKVKLFPNVIEELCSCFLDCLINDPLRADLLLCGFKVTNLLFPELTRSVHS